MLKQEFYKICSTGNDYIIIDNRKNIYNVQDQEDFIKKISNRKYSVGAEGVCFIELSNKADYKVRFFSADGKEKNIFLNGLKAAVRFSNEKEVAGNKQIVETKAGVLKVEVEDSIVSIVCPSLNKLELSHGLEIPHGFENKFLELSYVDMGSKYLVVELDNISKINVKQFAKIVSLAPRHQPDGVNVVFYEVIDNYNINVLTYDKVLKNFVNSSGNGVYAAYLIARTKKYISSNVLAHSLGGVLKVEEKEDQTILKGEARISFLGYFEPKMLDFKLEQE
jgi:diaminopimelate epimerase